MSDPDDRDQGREEVLGKLRHLFTTGSGPGTDVDAREVLDAFLDQIDTIWDDSWCKAATDAEGYQWEAMKLRERAEAAEARVVELERREKLRSGHLPCGGCGGPHQFDTSVPSATWNAVIRAKGLSEFLCTNCILLEFVREGKSFTAELYGLGLHGTPVEFRVAGQVAKDAAAVQDENNALRWKLHEAESQVAALKAERERVEDNLQGVIRTVCQRVGEVAGVKVEGPAEAVQVVEEMAHYLADRDRLRAQVAELTEAWRTLSEASDIQDAHGSYWAWSPAERAAWDTLAALQPREAKP